MNTNDSFQAAGVSQQDATAGNVLLDLVAEGGDRVPCVHCAAQHAAEGSFAWTGVLIVIQVVALAGLGRVLWHLVQTNRQVDKRDRDPRLLSVLRMLLACGLSSYGASLVLLFWPTYWAVAVAFGVFAACAWRFAGQRAVFSHVLHAKRVERELEESFEQRSTELAELIADRTVDLESALRAADESSQSKSLFLANMSHEIRTPMNAIVGFTDLLEDDRTDPEKHREHVRTIRRNTKHLLSLINDVLDISKVEAGKLDVERIPTDVGRIVHDVRELFQQKAEQKHIELKVEIAKSVPAWVESDPTRLRQIVANLVSNAVKFTDVGTVRMTARYSAGEIWMTVHDTGPGMPRDVQKNLFRAFSQADASVTRTHGGTGLGLKISRDLAVLMNGDLSVESKVGEGTTFLLRIPAVAVGNDESGEENEEPVDPIALEGVRVLLVEDGEDNAKLARFCLTREGVEVERVENGQEALDRVSSDEDFDLILMDIQMPIMDGYEATRRLRDRGLSTPIIAATASALIEDRQRCIDLGCNDFIAKPYRRADMVAKCAQVLQAHERRAA